MNDLDEIYKEHILDHYKHPRNKKELTSPTFSKQTRNASCGDVLQLSVTLKDDKVLDVGFTGEGCAISQASASLLTDFIKGKTVDELKIITPGDVYSLLKISISPGRSNCALLSYKALSEGLKELPL